MLKSERFAGGRGTRVERGLVQKSVPWYRCAGVPYTQNAKADDWRGAEVENDEQKVTRLEGTQQSVTSTLQMRVEYYNGLRDRVDKRHRAGRGGSGGEGGSRRRSEKK